MKKSLNIKLVSLTTIVLIIGLFSTPIFAREEIARADIVKETINEEETLSTSAETYDGPYTYTVYKNKATIKKYNGQDKEIVIPEKMGGYDVAYISGYAFTECDSLVSVETPKTLLKIDFDAFSRCENLKRIILHEGLIEIGQGAFRSCSSLESISIPNSVKTTGSDCFNSCSSLKNVKMGSGLTTITERMFIDCSSLETVVLGENIQTIVFFSFLDCTSLTSIIIPETVTRIDDPVFEGTPDFTIYGKKGSYAESYALAKKFDFKAINTAAKINYTTHVQNEGWQNYIDDGKMSGTSGKGLRLEGIEIVSGIDGLGVSYTTHVQNEGWQKYVSNGKMSGTSGKGLRLEAIRIQLTGESAAKYDVIYRVHTQNMEWMGWAKNGENSGTAGYGYRLEGIEIQIVEKGSFSGDTKNAFKEAN